MGTCEFVLVGTCLCGCETVCVDVSVDCADVSILCVGDICMVCKYVSVLVLARY